MTDNAIVFAAANPVPDIRPWEAEAGSARIVATGRSDFKNQINNSLGFPAVFHGTLDVRATSITDEMCIAAAYAIAHYAEERGIEIKHFGNSYYVYRSTTFWDKEAKKRRKRSVYLGKLDKERGFIEREIPSFKPSYTTT